MKTVGMFAGGLVVGLVLIGAGMFGAMHVSDYNRDRAAGLRPTYEEASNHFKNSEGQRELDRMYDVYYAREMAKRGKSGTTK